MSRGGLPLLIAVDQEGGPIQHLHDGFTRFPGADVAHRHARRQTWPTMLAAAVAAEMRAVGVNMNLAPVGDLLTNALQSNRRSASIRQRSEFGRTDSYELHTRNAGQWSGSHRQAFSWPRRYQRRLAFGIAGDSPRPKALGFGRVATICRRIRRRCQHGDGIAYLVQRF